MDISDIRNFCIIAHIDHGKSTLADRFLELTKAISQRDMKHGQLLDTMDLEQERGITIKLQPVRMTWQGKVLNLIDTPGHVDFAYEVNRSLAACEGAILVVDATQGIQAQTLANLQQAEKHNLKIIPVLNKIDLPNSDIPKVLQELEDVLAIPREDVICVSAKSGDNVEAVLNAIVDRIPCPIGQNQPSRALIFDSVYDDYRGVIAYVRVIDGEFKRGDKIKLIGTKTHTEVLEVGHFTPRYFADSSLSKGHIGYIVTNLKDLHHVSVGDTVCLDKHPAEPLAGYMKQSPVVFASLFCVDNKHFENLREAIEKLALNDASLTYEPEKSTSLGLGFRCGFLGLLHLDIVKERLEREYDLELISTAPSVPYEVLTNTNEIIAISHPAELPEPNFIKEVREPWVKLEIYTPDNFMGGIIEYVTKGRGVIMNTEYLDQKRVRITFEMPLSTLVSDFYDRIKSISQGYASINYEIIGFREGNLVKLQIHVAGDNVPALSQIVIRSDAHHRGIAVLERLKKVIPKAQFQIALQAVIGGKVVARENISPMRKDVTGYLYGGDRTRKDKLLKKQKEGKKRLKAFGKIHIPQEAFMSLLKR
jgi:GTP-binding protein LepA